MDESELEQIRKARLEQLKGRGIGVSGAGSGSDVQAEAEQRKQAEAEARQSLLSQILEPAAFDRLARIRLVHETRAADVEDRLIMLARSGRLPGKVSEPQLKDLLTAVADTAAREKERCDRIVVSRRKGWGDLLEGLDDGDDDLSK